MRPDDLEIGAAIGQEIEDRTLDQRAAVLLRTGKDLGRRHPEGTHDALIKRPGRIMRDRPAQEGVAQVGHIDAGSRVHMSRQVNALQGNRLDRPGGFFKGFTHHRLLQRLAGIKMAGRLIQTQTERGVFLNHEQQAIAFDDRGDRRAGLPDVHFLSVTEANRTAAQALRRQKAALQVILLGLPGENRMRIGVPTETRAGESRVAATPETVKKLVAAKHEVIVQSGAGAGASVTDAAYEAAGAILADANTAFKADMVLKVRRPSPDELALMPPGTAVVAMLDPFDRAGLEQLASAGTTAFALEAAPRTTRAQSMDVLSSQANIAGYKAVMVAANAYQRFMPMLMTAAGTVKAARVVILGVGVAGLQAIATAKRLGAVIEASDVRPPVKEQVESLGAKFIDVAYETDEEREIAKGAGGYARPMPESWMKRQAAAVAERIKQADIVITTALIPGRKAPVLVTEEMVMSMKAGSVIVDMAVEQGGNCPLSEPGRTVTKHGVHIIGETNLPSMVAADASALYARNVIDFLKLVIDADGKLKIDLEDDIVKACLVVRDGQVLRA